MLLISLALVIAGLPLMILFYKRGYFEGIILAQILLLYFFQWYYIQARIGGFGWVSFYDWAVSEQPEYAVRWILPTAVRILSSLLNIEYVWLIWLLISCGTWFFGLVLFNMLLRRIGYDRKFAFIGTLMPLATYAFVNRVLITPDCFNFIIVMGIMWSIYQWRYNHDRRLLLILPLLFAVAAVTEFPIPPYGGWEGRWSYLTQDIIELVLTIGVWGVFVLNSLFSREIRSNLPKFTKMSFYFLPIYILVFIIAVDWDRWVVLASFIWVPLALESLKKLYNEKWRMIE